MDAKIQHGNPNDSSSIFPDHTLPMHGEVAMKNEETEVKNTLMEAVQLEIEMEKRKIREEIIASEIIRKRQELEQEVRMELMMEKQLMGMNMRHFLLNNSSGFLGSRSYLNESLLNVGNYLEDDLGKNLMRSSICGANNDSMQINPELLVNDDVVGDGGKQQMQHDVALGKWPFERDSSLVAAQVAEKSMAEFGGEVVCDQAMPSSRISGMKRKAETSASDEETASVASKNLQKKWYCSLCDIAATSAGGLNLHLHGKKHKAKEALSKCSDSASNISTDSHCAENLMQNVEQKEALVQPMEEEKIQMQPIEQEKSQVQPLEDKSQVQLMEDEKSQVTKKWECSLCQISATSETLLNLHFQGKKHKAKEALSKCSDTASNISTDSNCTENLMQTVEQKEALVQPMEEEKSPIEPIEEEKSQAQPMEEEKGQVTKKWECSLCQISATSEILLKSHLQGKKHKAKEAKLGVGRLSSEKCADSVKEKGEAVNKWYCSLCQVSAASEKNLEDHFKGKKHKAKAGLLHQEADNVESESTEKISEDATTVKEKSLEGKEGLKNEQETRDDSTKSSKGQVSEQIVKTGSKGDIGNIEGINSGELVKFWHCKMCNEGTYDEATMDNHRKSSKHMDMLRKIGGGLVVVSNRRKEAIEGGKVSQHATLNGNENEDKTDFSEETGERLVTANV